MTIDPDIREQTYQYFLQEAPELLQALEQDLFSLEETNNLNRVNNLMRTTHTLKGAAASIGLETIKSVAHSLEDIFTALCQPDLSIDEEVRALIFEGYECLRLPLTAELTGGQVNDAEVLDRTAAIFARLQEKLGDCFSKEAHIPSSEELGFDLTRSIFEFGVSQRLDELAAILNSGDVNAVYATIQTQAEVFLGLAESLNLAKFGAIASDVLAQLNAYPEKVLTITQSALTDFKEEQAAILRGRETASQETSPPSSPSSPSLSEEEELSNPLLESIWGGLEDWGSEVNQEQEHEEVALTTEVFVPQKKNPPANFPETSQNPKLAAETEPKEEQTEFFPPLPTPPSTPTPPKTEKDQNTLNPTVRIGVEHLEQLNYFIGELLTNQNRQSLQNEQLQAAVKTFLARLQQHTLQLSQLKDWADSSFIDGNGTLGNGSWKRKRGDTGTGRIPNSPIQNPKSTPLNPPLSRGGQNPQSPIQNPKSTPLNPPLSRGGQNPQSPIQNRFDSLELDRYSDSQLLIQSVLEDAVQLAEAADAIDLFTAQNHHTQEKQRRLLTSTRDTLMEARMLPLGEIFSRFPRILHQLAVLHKKQVTLELQGTEVLVDKVVFEKLYSPLLHLIRNAFDHGIESSNLRQQRGKPEKGQISICAYHRGRYLVIEVQDDGQGLDFEKIRQQAVKNQLVSPALASTLSEVQLKDLLFEAGFSTATEVNDLSGRGIGLDVVRAQLQALQGLVGIDSQPGCGTKFILQIPQSLTISKLLICQAGERSYALLSDAIEQILIPQPDRLRCWENGKVLRLGKGTDEKLIPIYKLAQVLDYFSIVSKDYSEIALKTPGLPQDQIQPVIIIRYQDALLGLEVDQLIGEQELVIRPLGTMMAAPSYVYGGSILPDGRLTLVLDGAALMQCVFYRQTNRSGSFRESSLQVTDLKSPSNLLPSNLQNLKQLPGQERAALPPAPTPDFRAIPNKLVLLVDDSITVRQTLALTLQKAGYQVVQAKDGYEAIEQLRQQTDISLVICDIEMPRMNGFEFLKYRQQDPSLKDIPVVILTSRSGDKHRIIASELGATDYITKPYLEPNLLSTVKDTLAKNLSVSC
ncbi:MAG: hybrid sensor histidine kinase/response regulator [Potamolinea sp.]